MNITDEMIMRIGDVAIERDRLKAENAALRAERDKARAILATIAAGINDYEDQLQNWIAGQIDTALMGQLKVAE